MHVKHDSFILSFSTTSLRACATSRSMNQSTWMLKCLNLSCSLNQMFVQEAQRVCVLFCIFYEVYRCKCGAFFFSKTQRNTQRIPEPVCAVTK